MSGDLFQQPTSTYYPLFNASDTMTWQHSAHTFNFGFSWYHEQDHYWNPPSGIASLRIWGCYGRSCIESDRERADRASFAHSAQQKEGEQLYAILTGDIGATNGYAVRTAFPLNAQTKQYDNPRHRSCSMKCSTPGAFLPGLLQDKTQLHAKLRIALGLHG